MIADKLKSVFENAYDQKEWLTLLRDVFGAKNLLIKPQLVDTTDRKDWEARAFELGHFETIEGHKVGIYEVQVNQKVKLDRNKIGLRNLLRPIYNNDVDAALVVFNQSNKWRFSYVSEIRVLNKETGKREKKSTDPKRYTYVFGAGQKCRTAAERFEKIQLHFNLFGGGVKLEEIEAAFSVDTLTKDFYRELSDWYFRALREVEFPNDAERDKEIRNPTNVIRLITRLIFVWFLKQKGLVPEELFIKSEIDKMLNYKDKTGSTFYKAILQNLFFATLNTEMGDGNRKFINRQHGIQGFYRYSRFFKNAELFLRLTSNIPFLNGGLFENLDKNAGEEKEIRVDCFSDRLDNEGRLTIPDSLFFATKVVDLSRDYGDTRRRSQKVRGLIDILQSYNFTIEENTPFEIEVALDPELLGQVFENLLASYVPETESTARKMTGSFYTPREIVDYMVDESLKSYLKHKLAAKDCTAAESNQLDEAIFQLFSYTTAKHLFTSEQAKTLIKAIDDIKVLDPACGSGAFPMGALHKMVFLLTRLDEGNEVWKALQRGKALKETEEAFKLGNRTDREQRLLDISEAFEENSDDYSRKLYLIENCIYGVDIQPIAVQISKLRFFISLICDQQISNQKKNLGVRPLPNLETRFVAANALISLERPSQLPIGYDQVKDLEKQLDDIRHKHFSARTPKTKIKWREKDLELRGKISEKMKLLGFPNSTAEQVSQWNPYDPSISADYFDKEHMFGLDEGFDIVLGNPPYIRIQTLDKSLKKYFSDKYESATKNYDLYVLFDECGMNLLKAGGNLIYIQSNKFLNSDYGIGVRGLVADNKWLYSIVDFGAAQMFSSVTTYTCILHCRKAENASFQFVGFTGNEITDSFVSYSLTRKITNDIVGEVFHSNFISKNQWNFGSTGSIDIFTQIEANGVKLKELVLSIFVGLQTSADPVYIVEQKGDGYYSRHLDDFVKLEDAFLKPLLKGSEIRRYKIDYQNLKLVFPYQMVQGRMTLVSPTEFKAKSPLTWKYLKRCEEKLRGRENGKMDRDDWYAYVYPKNLEDFHETKIMTQVLAKQSSMVLDDDQGYYFVGGGNAGGYGIALKENSKISYKYLLGLLNSKLLDYYLQNHSSKFQNDYFSYSKRFTENIPINIADEKTMSIVENFVDYIALCRKIESDGDLQNIGSYFEQIVNAIVYELYLPNQIRLAGCEIIKSIPLLNPIAKFSSIGEKTEYLKSLFGVLYEKHHPVRTILYKLDGINEVAMAEGIKK
jgi:adenine-specific DNA-methyltransferase